MKRIIYGFSVIIAIIGMLSLSGCGDSETGDITSPGGGLSVPVTHIVFFDSNGGSLVNPIRDVEPGSAIAAPADPSIDRTDLNQGRFRGWFTDNGVFSTKYDFSSPVNATITLYADWGYRPGETGPGGGVIVLRDEPIFWRDGFYVMESPSGSTPAWPSYKAYYLELSPDLGSLEWSLTISSYLGSLGNGTGYGRWNTAIILASDSAAPASKACRDYRGGGKDDWYLPTMEEFGYIYPLIGQSGIPNTGEYWCSIGGGEYTIAMHLPDYSGSYYFANTKKSVRAMRAF